MVGRVAIPNGTIVDDLKDILYASPKFAVHPGTIHHISIDGQTLDIRAPVPITGNEIFVHLSQEKRLCRTFKISPRSLVKERVSNGHIFDFSDVLLGGYPKHFNSTFPAVILTDQIYTIYEECTQLQELTAIPDKNIILCGPMGVGKSYILWTIAAMLYANNKPLVYIPDCYSWLSFSQLLHYFIDNFLAFNRDLLSENEINDLESKTVTYDYFAIVLKKLQPIILLDEHAALVRKYLNDDQLKNNERWIQQFIYLQGRETGNVLVLASTSHADFELEYLKNGMQKCRRFITPMKEHEAVLLLQMLDPQNMNQENYEYILQVCNYVPREIRSFIESHKLIDFQKRVGYFLKDRIDTFVLDGRRYYQKLNTNSKNDFLCTIYDLLKSETNSIKECLGFVDLGMCYRIMEADILRIRPLCQAATLALMQILTEEMPKQERFLQILNDLYNSTLKSGDDFEELIWILLLRDTIGGNGLTVTPYNLKGEQGSSRIVKFDSFYVAPNLSSIPKHLCSENVLVRMTNDFPRWDFISGKALFQLSISDFQVHNKVKSKNISNSFTTEKDGVADILTHITTTKNVKGVIENGNIQVTSTDDHFKQPEFYFITLKKPNHPRLYATYSNLQVIAAEEVWGKKQPTIDDNERKGRKKHSREKESREENKAKREEKEEKRETERDEEKQRKRRRK